MKLKKIKITNFKGIENLEHEFKNKTLVLAGKNGRGKTSFKEAVYATMTGVLPDNAIQKGKDFTVLEAELDDGTTFSREIDAIKPTKVYLNGRHTTGKALSEMVESLTGVSKETMKVVTSEEVVTGMTAGQFGDFIVKYIPERLNADTVISYIPGISEEVEDELRKILPVMPEEFDVETLRQAFDHCFEQRKACKKDVAARQAKVDSFNKKEPTRKLSVVEDDLTKVIGAEASQKAKEEAIKMYKAATANREKALADLEALKVEVDSIVAAKPNPTVAEDIDKHINEENKRILDAKILIKTINDNISIFTDTLVNLGKPVCPLSETLVCTTDKTAIKAEVEELIESNREGLEIQESIVKKSEENIENLNLKKEEYNNALKLYEKKVQLNATYEKQKKLLPPVPAKPSEELVVIDFAEEKEKLQKERDEIIAYNEYLKDVSVLEKLTKRLETYEALCKILQPKGEVMSSLMSLYMSVFETAVNDRAAKLKPGFEMKFIPIDGVSYLVKPNAASDYQNFDSLSSGEKTLAMFLILDMLNTLSGLKILMLDDLDKLDKNSFSELFELIQSPEIQDSYDHIIVCTVDHDDTLETLDKYKGTIDII